MKERTRVQEQFFNIVESLSPALKNPDLVKKLVVFWVACKRGRVSVRETRLVYDLRVCERKLILKGHSESDLTIFLPLDFPQGWKREQRDTAVANSVVEAASILEGLSGQSFIRNSKLTDNLADSLI